VDGNTLAYAAMPGDEEPIHILWVPTAVRSVAQLIQLAAASRRNLVFHWLIGVANESELEVAAALCADLHFATALVAIEEARFDFENPITVRVLMRRRNAEISCRLP
jgi:hypothetical protein